MNKYKEYICEEKASVDISVYVLTYFHEQYIEQCLNSILSQRTNFSYEIIVSDDCSKDKTVEILKRYQQQYPEIIRLNLNKENVGIPENIYRARCMCRGKYIINIAGDDYFINDRALEQKALILKNNSDYFAVCSRTELRYDDDEETFKILPTAKNCNKRFTLKDYENGKDLNCHGLMIRNPFLSEKGKDYFAISRLISDKVDDAVDCTIMLLIGDAYIMDCITDVYRVPRDKTISNNYNSKFSRREKMKQEIELYNSMYYYLNESIDFKKRFEQSVATLVIRAILDKDYKNYQEIYITIPEEYRTGNDKILFKSILLSIKMIINRIKISKYK